MTMLTDEHIGSGTVRFAKDYVGLDCHNPGHSHIDAVCHVAFEGSIYGGRPSDTITSAGAQAGTIEALKHGLGRGVLLDIPRLRGVVLDESGRFPTKQSCRSPAAAVEVDEEEQRSPHGRRTAPFRAKQHSSREGSSA